jgi:hypothetical protein
VPQLVEGDEFFDSHLLIPRTLAVDLGELLEPRLCFPFGVTAQLRSRVSELPRTLLSRHFGE